MRTADTLIMVIMVTGTTMTTVPMPDDATTTFEPPTCTFWRTP